MKIEKRKKFIRVACAPRFYSCLWQNCVPKNIFMAYNEFMQIIAKCPSCGDSWLFDADAADRRMRCQRCRRLFKIPKLEEVSKAVKIIKQAKVDVYVDDDGKTYG